MAEPGVAEEAGPAGVTSTGTEPEIWEDSGHSATVGAGEEPGTAAGEESTPSAAAGTGADRESVPTAPAATAIEPRAGEESAPGTGVSGVEPDGSWLHGEELRLLRQRYRDIQVSFVDGPGTAVRDANTLVADLMRRLAQALFDERAALETRCLGRDDVSTEELRQGLRRYRAIFDWLVASSW